jgi:hypothetical protein
MTFFEITWGTFLYNAASNLEKYKGEKDEKNLVYCTCAYAGSMLCDPAQK